MKNVMEVLNGVVVSVVLLLAGGGLGYVLSKETRCENSCCPCVKCECVNCKCCKCDGCKAEVVEPEVKPIGSSAEGV
jgi:hypothetical protein